MSPWLSGVVALWDPFAKLLLDNVDTVRDSVGNAPATAVEKGMKVC